MNLCVPCVLFTALVIFMIVWYIEIVTTPLPHNSTTSTNVIYNYSFTPDPACMMYVVQNLSCTESSKCYGTLDKTHYPNRSIAELACCSDSKCLFNAYSFNGDKEWYKVISLSPGSNWWYRYDRGKKPNNTIN
jgi:hypothetical protein